MGIQVVFPQLVAALLASSSPQGGCFDFSTKVTHPLREVPLAAGPADRDSSGKYEDGRLWAAVRGRVDKPLVTVLTLLEDHSTTKSPSADAEVSRIADPKYIARHKVKFKVTPFPLVSVKWEEDWAYAVSEGEAASPRAVVVSYEKTGGTSHIRHLCGSIVLREAFHGATDVYEYEEVDATRRSLDDEVVGLKATLRTLRGGPRG